MTRSSKVSRGPGRPRRRPPNWLTIVVSLAIVGGLYWYQGPADVPWKNPKVRPSQESSTDAAQGDATTDPTIDAESSTTPDRDGGVSSESRSAPAPAGASVSKAEPASPSKPPKKLSPIVRGVKIRDLAGKVVYQGDVDLRETLKRIEAGSRLEFPNDGAIFQNREKRLPTKSADYYREWVHRTPKLSGPGPQRVVTGSNAEAYYTPDHYATFLRIR